MIKGKFVATVKIDIIGRTVQTAARRWMEVQTLECKICDKEREKVASRRCAK